MYNSKNMNVIARRGIQRGRKSHENITYWLDWLRPTEI